MPNIFQMSNFAMGTILGKGFAQAQVHTNHSTSAEALGATFINFWIKKKIYFFFF